MLAARVVNFFLSGQESWPMAGINGDPSAINPSHGQADILNPHKEI